MKRTKQGAPSPFAAYGGIPATLVIQAGVDSIEHGWFLTDDQLRMMKDKGIFLAGTDFPAAHFIASGFPGGAEKSAAAIDRLHRAYNIGVKMAFSTDIVTAMPGESRADIGLGLPRRLAPGRHPARRRPEIDDHDCR